jgi:hypothetical protein
MQLILKMCPGKQEMTHSAEHYSNLHHVYRLQKHSQSNFMPLKLLQKFSEIISYMIPTLVNFSVIFYVSWQ